MIRSARLQVGAALADAADVVSVHFLGIMVRYFEYDDAERAQARKDLPRSSTQFLMGGLPSLLEP